MAKVNEVRTRAKMLALHIIAVCDEIDTRKGRGVLVNQIVRSATSIGANIREAKYAHSKADFIARLQIALKEANEPVIGLNCYSEHNIYPKQNINRRILRVQASGLC